MNTPTPTKPAKKKGKLIWKIIRRFFLCLFTVVILLVAGLYLVCNMIFNGPSETARNVLTMSLLEASATKWVPALFIGDAKVEEIQSSVDSTLPGEVSNSNQIIIQENETPDSISEWADYKDGIRIEQIKGDTYNAYVMIIRDPSQVYVQTSLYPGQSFSVEVPGKPINLTMMETGTIAGINAGAFWDDGTGKATIGSVPQGIVVSEGQIVWDDGKSYNGFVGITEDNILLVANSMNAAKVKELKIRDGCCFGPVLIMDGTINETAYNQNSGYNPRTAIGQRADGAIIFLCIDGRQVGSLGGTYTDIINIMVEYGAVNAFNLDGGSSSVMFYRDTYGRYGEEGALMMVNSYSLLQETPRKMPTYFMVRPLRED